LRTLYTEFFTGGGQCPKRLRFTPGYQQIGKPPIPSFTRFGDSSVGPSGYYREYIDNGYSGKNTQRPAFTEMLNDARHRQFDLLIVWKLDRLSRSLKDLIATLDELGHLGIDFVSYDNQLDTSSPSGKLVFNIIGAVAEFERDIISERVRAGLANARIKGKKLGRPQIPKSYQKKIIALKNQGLSNRAIGRQLSISESTVRNWLRFESKIH
jgi:DNA invertase Pin-like site-specific DNA recombinase